jgi:hypothetical protein
MADIRRLVQFVPVRNQVPNPSAEADATYWAATSGAGSMSAPSSVAGARTSAQGAKHVESTGTAVTAAAGCQLHTSTSPNAAPGQRVYAYAWGKVGTTATSLRLDIIWLDSAGAVLSTSTVQTQASPTTGTWYELQGAATAPANTVFARLAVWMNNSTTTPQIFVDDAALVVDPTYAAGYFEGPSSYTTTVKDLETSPTFQAVMGSFAIKAPERQTSMSGAARRYEGSRAITETHQNAEISWKALVRGSTPDLAVQNVEDMIAAIEPLAMAGLHLEWRPDGATYSTFYEVRGPAKWQPDYKWAQFVGAYSMCVDIAIPVAPLAKGLGSFQTITSFTSPNVVQLPTAIGGKAPAQAAITINKANGQPTSAFALVAWWQRLPTPPAGYNPVFGIIEAETTLSGGTLTTWAATADAGSRGGNRLIATVTTGGSAVAQYGISTAGLSGTTVDVEVWAKVRKSSPIVSPRYIVSAFTSGGSAARIYTNEWGQTGKAMTTQTNSGNAITRLGVLSLPLIGVSDRWTLNVEATWATSASSSVAMDWLMLVPANARAVSVTGEALDSSYPRFGPSGTGQFAKTIMPNLSGVLTTGSISAPDVGLGGSVLELPTGNVDLAVLLSDTIPDEPSGGVSDVSKEWTTTIGNVVVTPRYFLVKGA